MLIEKEAVMNINYRLLIKIYRKIAVSLALGLSFLAPKLLLAEIINDPVNAILNNGIYFYGKSPERDKLGVEYLIFKVQNNQLIGTFYMPQSEFSCFSGQVEQDKISLAIMDTYDNSIYPYSIALENQSPLASEGENLVRNLGLSGFNQIEKYNEQDLELLNICEKDLSNK